MTSKNLLLLISALCAVLLVSACSLSSSDRPPTLVPRATQTPPPTIGYATLSPDQFPTLAASPTPSVEVQLFSLTNQVEADRLIIHIDTLQNFHTRHINSFYNSTTVGIGAAYNYILGQFQAIQTQSEGRFVITHHDFSLDWGGIRSTPKNIVGILQGNEVGAGVIVLAAHYDSRIGNLEDGNGYAPGANDNGSGVAALIEIARILSHRQHRATIVFVAFSAEEEGRLGSLAFVRDFVQAYTLPVTAMLDMDIIGSSTASDGSINDRQIRLFSEGPDPSFSRQLARDINFIGFNYVPNMEFVIQELVVHHRGD